MEAFPLNKVAASYYVGKNRWICSVAKMNDKEQDRPVICLFCESDGWYNAVQAVCQSPRTRKAIWQCCSCWVVPWHRSKSSGKNWEPAWYLRGNCQCYAYSRSRQRYPPEKTTEMQSQCSVSNRLLAHLPVCLCLSICLFVCLSTCLSLYSVTFYSHTWYAVRTRGQKTWKHLVLTQFMEVKITPFNRRLINRIIRIFT